MNLFLLRRPQICNSWQQEVIHAEVAGNLPGKDEQYCQTEEDTVDAGRTSHDEVPVHEAAEESGKAYEDTSDQQDTEHHFADGNYFGEPGICLRIEHGLDEFPIPGKSDRGASFSRDLNGACPEAFERSACLHPSRVTQLGKTGLNPLQAQPYTDDEPEDGEALVTEDHVDDRWRFERLTFTGSNISRHFN